MSQVTTFERTHAQRMEALLKANEIRVHMANERKRLKAGTTTLDDVLGDPRCGSMYVAQALQAIPRFGPGKADRVMRRAGVSPSKRIGGLTDRQRTAIIAEAGYFPAARGVLL